MPPLISKAEKKVTMFDSNRFSASDLMPAKGAKKVNDEFNKGEYSSLQDESDITLLDEQPKHRRKTHSRVFIILWISFALAFVGATSYLSHKINNIKSALQQHPTVIHTGSELGSCGSSIAEARAAGCHYDPMSSAWFSHACWEPHVDMIEEWKGLADWHFFTDVDMRAEDEVSLQSVYNGDHLTLFTPSKYHKVHCSYMWRKTHAILTKRLPIDDNTLNVPHMKHCQRVLLNEYFHEDSNCTETPTQVCPIRIIQEFAKCGYF